MRHGLSTSSCSSRDRVRRGSWIRAISSQSASEHHNLEDTPRHSATARWRMLVQFVLLQLENAAGHDVCGRWLQWCVVMCAAPTALTTALAQTGGCPFNVNIIHVIVTATFRAPPCTHHLGHPHLIPASYSFPPASVSVSVSVSASPTCLQPQATAPRASHHLFYITCE